MRSAPRRSEQLARPRGPPVGQVAQHLRERSLQPHAVLHLRTIWMNAPVCTRTRLRARDGG